MLLNNSFSFVKSRFLLRSPPLFEAIVALVSLYYVFDIAYPKTCSNTLLFLERFVFRITTGPSLSKTLIGTISDIEKN